MADNRFLKSHQFIFQKRKKKEERKEEKERKKGGKAFKFNQQVTRYSTNSRGIGGQGRKTTAGCTLRDGWF